MALTSGTKLGPYEIESPLGAGGMGEVYRARDTRLDRIVAIKVVGERRQPDRKTHEHLLREARTASKLNHANICTIYEVGEAENLVYVAMEYVAGRTLSDLRGVRGLDSQTVIRYGIQIADALAHAHEHGIVHRDLKSDNIVVTPDGRVKILDFGLAEHFVVKDIEQSTLSETAPSDQQFAGTLAYMAPEVLRGQAADARADIWALGIVLHEIASGKRPFGGATPFEISSAILNGIPAALPGDIPAALRSIIERCLRKEPAHRYQRLGEVRAALEAIDT